MPTRDDTSSLHGNAPDNCSVALLLIDVINPLDFPEADQFLQFAIPAADRLSKLTSRAQDAGVPVVYANDNFGRWRSDHTAVIDRCLEPNCLGRPLVERLRPETDDYFVLKPKHSAFFSTTLDTLLRYLGTRTLVVGGFAADICVLFTANDAYMRDLQLIVPSDGVASNDETDCRAALKLMRRVLKAETPLAGEIDFSQLISRRAGAK